METDADRRFRRLAAAIAHDADPDDVPDLTIDVRGRTFSYQERGDDGRLRTRHVAVLEHMLKVSTGIGQMASEAWGQPLSDEEGWFRFTLVNWDDSIAKTKDTGSGWWTFGAGRGVAPVPPWEAHDYRPGPDTFQPFRDPEPIDDPPSRPKPRRRR
ncbi:hypothetical protein [Pseudokineococcus sp. 1T1Z-3]|uniref:hypothetical protein n=1 Tax=Pseudokineococcus sp. 1T1Z-3 TaxID=3132745 RepID=UPI0030AB8E99